VTRNPKSSLSETRGARPGVTRALRRLSGAIVLVALAAGWSLEPGSSSQAATTRAPSAWSMEVCRQVARGVAWQGEQALRHYRPPQSTYPPDVALLIVRTGVGGLERHRCPPRIVGVALSRRLTRGQQAELFTHLPQDVVRYLRLGLARV
jgi:hypothetical protein